MRCDIRLSGSGGQGLILAGVILGEALALVEDKYVVQTRSFGPEARGGASKSDVIFSDTEIFYTKARRLNILLALSQKACDEYASSLAPRGVLIVDPKYVKKYPKKGIALPFSEISQKKFNTELFANIMSLGAISALTKIVTTEDLASALHSQAPPETLDANIEALSLGKELALRKQRK